MSVLVTGAGSVGLAVALKFAQEGFDVVCYDVDPTSPRALSVLEEVEGKVKSVRGDVQDPVRMIDVIKENSIQGIIHTAALTIRGSGVRFATAQFSVNAVGTLNVLEAARIMDLNRIIFTSSIALFSGIPPDRVEPIKETEPIDPSSFTMFYSVAKYAGESLVHAYHKLYEMDTVICRLHTVYGIAEINPRDIGSYLWSVLKGERLAYPSGAEIVSDFSYSKDLAEGIYVLYTSKKIKDPRIYHLSDGRTRRLGDIVNMINIMGPGEVKLGPGKEGSRITIPTPFDISRAKELGYKPRPIQESLEDYAAWIRKQLKKEFLPQGSTIGPLSQ